MDSYQQLCTEFYDIDKPNPPEDALAFYTGYAQNNQGLILEPMSGSGRFLLPLLKRGFRVEGMDASPEMLQACRSAATARGLSPVLYQQYLHELDLPCRYDLAFIPSGSFCLLTSLVEARESLRRIYRVLLPGARFVMEVERQMEETSSSGPWGGRWVTRPDGARIVISWLSHFDAITHLKHSIHRYELVKNGQLLATEFEYFDLRFYSVPEIEMLLTETGFVEVRTGKPFSFAPLADTDDTIIVECRKP